MVLTLLQPLPLCWRTDVNPRTTVAVWFVVCASLNQQHLGWRRRTNLTLAFANATLVPHRDALAILVFHIDVEYSTMTGITPADSIRHPAHHCWTSNEALKQQPPPTNSSFRLIPANELHRPCGHPRPLPLPLQLPYQQTRPCRRSISPTKAG